MCQDVHAYPPWVQAKTLAPEEAPASDYAGEQERDVRRVERKVHKEAAELRAGLKILLRMYKDLLIKGVELSLWKLKCGEWLMRESLAIKNKHF